jgi:hypothetical protein
MTEINNSGYQNIRKVVNSSLTSSQWDYIELQDTNDNIVTRVSITGDSRFSWTTAATDQTQTAQGTVSGSDSDISTTVTLAKSVLKATNTAAADELHTETFPDATLANSSDEVKITHNVEVPKL